MKKYVILLPVLLTSLFILSCSMEKGESEEAMIKASNELDKKFAESFSKGDLNGIMETYWNSPDLVSYAPDIADAANYEKAKQDMTKFFETMKGARLELTNSKNRVEGNVVLGSGNWTLTLPDSAGTKINGRYSDVKAKKDGKWVYIQDHASVPLVVPQ